MSFLIRNLTATPIEINDIGLTLEVSADLDLIPESANIISMSDDLIGFITAGQIKVIDPLDGVTVLSTVDSLKVINLANDPHYGIQSGKLNQIDDVDVTVPTHDYVLTYNSVSGKWEPKQVSGTSTPTPSCFPFYRADGTYDSIATISGLFPFYRADGTYDPINLGACN